MKTLHTNIKTKCTAKYIHEATDVFNYIASGFKDLTKEDSKPHDELQVLENTKDGTFKDIFDLGVPLDELALTQEEIIDFCENNKDKLSPNWYTFFLLKSDGDFFVAYVDFGDREHLGVDVYRLENVNVWLADCRHRVVVPQLENLNLTGFETLDTLPDTLEINGVVYKKANK